jgi:hypothetical protein
MEGALLAIIVAHDKLCKRVGALKICGWCMRS